MESGVASLLDRKPIFTGAFSAIGSDLTVSDLGTSLATFVEADFFPAFWPSLVSDLVVLASDLMVPDSVLDVLDLDLAVLDLVDLVDLVLDLEPDLVDLVSGRTLGASLSIEERATSESVEREESPFARFSSTCSCSSS